MLFSAVNASVFFLRQHQLNSPSISFASDVVETSSKDRFGGDDS